MSDGWICERGIGETRFALVEDGEIAEAHIDRAGELRFGSVHQGRLTRKLGRGGEADIAGETVFLPAWPEGRTEGAAVPLRIEREAIPERGRARSAKAVMTDAAAAVPQAMTGDLEAAGWSNLIDDARTGVIAFNGGLLTIVPTPAGTTIDIDGSLAMEALALAGVQAAARAVRRLGITGSILIDVPGVEGKAARQRIAAAFDRLLPLPFERTGINGFGLLQVVRPRRRPSLMERAQNQAAATAALDLLRRAERAGAKHHLDLSAGQAVRDWLAARPALIEELFRRTGVAPTLNSKGHDPLWWGDVSAN
ncbi:ribonuclease [Pacificimonas sp. WHA3]|uniref:Ribonuclease n=1 Tax=Pacificimonas pallii TaxID=2827236 RepID=A0ABS6SCG2_9SPHN|nr:ribonuclease [Pacificimonas pallii]MBV7256011.1 ribonuclease [Pacificimonas pallii]